MAKLASHITVGGVTYSVSRSKFGYYATKNGQRVTGNFKNLDLLEKALERL
ncbi:hypothetical protein [Vibrio phage vB_VpaS_AL-2]|nr:hypothetical protein [Vibrio phage vB_VpaS_AL-2]